MTITVVLTREPPRNDPLRAAVGENCRVLEVPLTSTEFVDESVVASQIAASADAHQFQTVVFTSARAVRYGALALGFATPDASVAAVGPHTLAALSALDLSGHGDLLTGASASAVDLAAVVTRGPVLALAAAQARAELRDALHARHVALTEVACYRTVPVELTGLTREELRLAEIIVIAAPSAWRVARADVRKGTTVIALGPTTAAEVAATHPLVVTATEGDLVRALREEVARVDAAIER